MLNPFDPENQSSSRMEQPQSEVIFIRGRRSIDMDIVLSDTAPIDDDRDAFMLDALLQTHLPPETYSRLAHIMAERYESSRARLDEILKQKPKRRIAKEDPEDDDS